MLQLSNMLINRPVLSLRTGTQVATTTDPIINPNNLKIEGFYCQDDFNHRQILVLVEQDIRDILPQGIVINDYDVLASLDELVRLRDVINLDFELLGKPVVTVDKNRMGKVADFATDVDSMFIQKLYVTRSKIRSLTGGELGVDRSQIVEITRKQIVISNPLKGVPSHAPAVA